MVSRWLNPAEERLWRRYRRLVVLLEARLAGELADATGLSMADYTVLSALVEADDRRCRVTALAEHMQWSQSRLSHHLRRMEDRGLLRRRPAETDGRGAVVELTRQGLRAIAAAAPIHFAGVREHMFDRLTTDQLEAFEKAMDAVLIPMLDDEESE
ncbi:MAG: MarR family transcriptional regulator [Actinobacteria bacterium]|nr:MarR family transcriptional regulator [Actinomycetota bacterium]